MHRWRPPTTKEDFRPRLKRVVTPWIGTPYRAGHQMPGVGTDCVRFVCGVLDAMCKRPPVSFETLPFDASLHNREGAVASMLAIRQRFRPNSMVPTDFLEPGDIVLSGPSGVAHALLVGWEPNEFWHASHMAGGVVRSGLSYFKDHPIGYVIRSDDREGWAHD